MPHVLVRDIVVKKLDVEGVLIKIIIRVNKKSNITIELVTIKEFRNFIVS